MLADPRNFDFRPQVNSMLANLSAGAYSVSDPTPWTAGASEIWVPMMPPKFGCKDQLANNFDLDANIEDHTCDYDLDDDGVLDINEVDGCTNSTANNYNSSATDDDGSCTFNDVSICTEDLCSDGSTRNPVDCSCPVEGKASDSKSNIFETVPNFVLIILVSLFVLVAIFLRKRNNP